MSAHIDRFVRDNLPRPEQWPKLFFDLPHLHYPRVLNCAAELLDYAARDCPEAIAIRALDMQWSYGRVRATVNQLCRVLTEYLGVVPGNRVLLRGANSPMMMVAWLAVA